MLVDQLTAVIIEELHRQASVSGCTTEDNGKLVQVDGSFDASQLAEAVICVVDRGGATASRWKNSKHKAGT